jgi:hypothetical protein
MAAVFLQIASNIAKQGDIENGGNYQKKEGADEDDHRESDGDQEAAGDHILAIDISTDIIPVARSRALSQIEGVKSQGVDSLSRPVS